MNTCPLFDPADFRIPAGVAHVCAGGETAFLLRHDDALRRYAIDKSNGMPGRAAQEAQVERARVRLDSSATLPKASRSLPKVWSGVTATISASTPWNIRPWLRRSHCGAVWRCASRAARHRIGWHPVSIPGRELSVSVTYRI
jgi:hypothetical protein